ncbi:MAG: hypothetical protein ACODAQ_02010 [Phycisphaeraceae bacterium]
MHAANLMKRIFSRIDLVELEPVVGRRGAIQLHGYLKVEGLLSTTLDQHMPADASTGESADETDGQPATKAAVAQPNRRRTRTRN